MKFTQFLAIFVGALATASAARADTVVLKNGDHLTGAVEVSDGKDVTLKTAYAGEIKIQWSSVQELKTDKPIYIVTPDKKTRKGGWPSRSPPSDPGGCPVQAPLGRAL